MALISWILRAVVQIANDCFVSVKGQQDLTLKGQTFFLGFGPAPIVGVRFFTAIFIFRVEVELDVPGVVGDGAGVPKCGMLPSRRADEEGGHLRPGFHAASFGLADHAEMALYDFELRKCPEQSQGFSRAQKKFGVAGDFDPVYLQRAPPRTRQRRPSPMPNCRFHIRHRRTKLKSRTAGCGFYLAALPSADGFTSASKRLMLSSEAIPSPWALKLGTMRWRSTEGARAWMSSMETA